MTRYLVLVLVTVALGAACVVGESKLTWEEFQAAYARQVDGRTVYVVESGICAIPESELRGYYERYLAGTLDQSSQASTVNQTADGNDDIWSDADKRNLSYCVTDDFGDMKERVVREMEAATAAWERVADVDFVYVEDQDGKCDNTNGSVRFPVRPWTGGGACAFFPTTGGGCVRPDPGHRLRRLRDQLVLRDERAQRHHRGRVPPASSATSSGCATGTFAASTCAEGGGYRDLTPYDQGSVMHYPWCDGVTH